MLQPRDPGGAQSSRNTFRNDRPAGRGHRGDEVPVNLSAGGRTGSAPRAAPRGRTRPRTASDRNRAGPRQNHRSRGRCRVLSADVDLVDFELLRCSTRAQFAAMVANLTIGRKKYAEVNEVMEDLSARFEELARQLIIDVDRDSDAYNRVFAAFKLPKETEEEKNIRSEAIQKAISK